MPDHSGLTVGIDIGGTKIAAGLVDASGTIKFKTRVPMVTSEDASAAFTCVCNAIQVVLDAHPEVRHSELGIGICAPGPLDPRTGIILNPPNVPCWRDFPLADEVRRRFGVSARIDNDANAAALAEALWGAGVGYGNVFYATLGTGIGTGIVFDKQIYYGRTGSAAEGGHMSIDYNGPRCSCGKRGCIETFCSGPAIAQRARARIAATGSRSRIVELAGAPDQLVAEHVGQAFQEGDKVASEILRDVADLMVVWIGNIIDLLEPDVIVIGGGVAELMSSFFDHIADRLPQWSLNQRCREIPIVRAYYGAEAGIAGAAALFCSSSVSDGKASSAKTSMPKTATHADRF